MQADIAAKPRLSTLSASNLRLRPAHRHDVQALLPLVYASGPAAFDYVFAHGGRKAVDFIASALADDRGLIAWSRHHVAVIDDRIVGCVAMYGGHELAPLANATLRQYFRFYAPWTAFSVLRRALRVGAMQPPPERGDFYIAHLSVAPAWQRAGIATQLLDYAMQTARARGHRHCALDVASDNRAARKLYEKKGFRLIEERALSQRAEQVPSSCRLRRAIDTKMRNN